MCVQGHKRTNIIAKIEPVQQLYMSPHPCAEMTENAGTAKEDQENGLDQRACFGCLYFSQALLGSGKQPVRSWIFPYRGHTFITLDLNHGLDVPRRALA